MVAGEPSQRRWGSARIYLALVVLCTALFCCTATGRITYPDDEIVFQTSESLVERGNLVVAGIAKRTGEPPGRPTGSFGWAPGPDGQRYGFFGHGMSLAAIPAYLVARASLPRVPEHWRHAVRSDLFTFHKRSLAADWTRLVTSLSNCLITPLAAVLLGLWLQALGYGLRPAVACAVIYALGTTAWPYAQTLLSEPLSALALLAAALAIAHWHRERRGHQLAVAGLIAGLSVHIHLLNLVALPCLLGYALAPSLRAGSLRAERRSWLIALALGALVIALLGVSHWWRFGSPFESGRYDHYGRWVSPLPGLAAMLVAPGRSVLLYSPPLLLALACWPAMRRRCGDAALFVLALAVTRLLFVACRSDWHGGWAIGPRYLVPIVPFVLAPLAELLTRWPTLAARRRAACVSALAASMLLQAWLALHSIFEWMWQLNLAHGRERYYVVADWQLSAAPPLAFARMQARAFDFARAGDWAAARMTARFDALAFGAWRLAKLSEADGLWQLLLALGGLGLIAAVVLLRFWWRGPAAIRRRSDP